jgi:hypothetical protein
MAKVRNRKVEDYKHRKKRLLWLSIALAVFSLIIIWVVWLSSSSLHTQAQLTPKAAIIDQLYLDNPNQNMTQTITQYLEDYGFQVDIYQGNDVTVNFYRNLAKDGYNLIIIRGHSGAMRYENVSERNSTGTYLFTTESYSTLKYPIEQLNGEIVEASLESDQPSFFAIGPKFITNNIKGKFNNTVVIIDGCSGLYSQDLANAFIAKGATAYLAWDAYVHLDYVDTATLSLINNLCSTNVTVAKAVDLTMIGNGPDPESNAALKYYPNDIGNLSVRELTKIK